MNARYLDKITLADCRGHLPQLEDDSIELLLSDIPYGIAMDDWESMRASHIIAGEEVEALNRCRSVA